MGLDPKEIAVTLLIVSVMFHYYSYSFSVQAYDYSDYDITLEIADLYASGIMIGEHAEHNISYGNATWTVFDLNETSIRMIWQDWALLGGDGIVAQQETKFFGFDAWIDFKFQNVFQQRNIRNSTIIALFEEDNNWSKVHALTGYVLFITDPLKQDNMTRAVQEDGNLTLTLAQDVAWAEEADLSNFISWYIGLVTGSETWGLPDSFSILVRLMTLLGIFSGVFLLIEARRLIRVV
jgi:hypothetical protein